MLVHGSQLTQPSPFDTASSPDTIYVRWDIKPDPDADYSPAWVYKEEQYPRTAAGVAEATARFQALYGDTYDALTRFYTETQEAINNG